MSSEQLWDHIKKEIDRFKTRRRIQTLSGTLEKIENLTNVGIAGKWRFQVKVKNALELIKGMQKEVKRRQSP